MTSTPPHADPIADVLRRLGADAEHGLAAVEVERRRALHGANELAEAEPPHTLLRLLRQFREPIVLLLIAAACISLALGEVLDAFAILAIVILNGVLGFLQEERAARALEELRELSRPRARVVRGGREELIGAHELVPGDVVRIEAGDAIPADARLLETTALQVQEAALTGESAPVEKDARAELDVAAMLAERRNCVWLGTLATAGHAKAVVTATGMATELGRIAELLKRTQPRPTPLQERLSVVGRQLAVAALAIVAALAALHLARGEGLGDTLVLSIGLAVAAVPEGLPALVTLALALGMRRLVRRNALVRELPGVETLGSVTVICTDKTGTLTRNEMTVREVWTPAGSVVFAGSGYAPEGAVTREDGADARGDAGLVRALTAAARCNGARLEPPRGPGADWTVVGDPTEGALLVAARKAGIPLELGPGEHVIFEVPFDSERRRMSVAVAGTSGTVIHVKGAPEALLPLCTAVERDGRREPLDAAWRARIEQRASELGARALRVLALAFREGDVDPAQAETGLVLAGLAGMQDPPRANVAEAVRTCRTAGIRPVMITGDHPETAIAIAREIGIAEDGDRAVSGAELAGWDDAELAASIDRCAVFGRTSAEQKLRIVRAWRSRNAVVAMTGDGVNDAPALQEADIGIAMGRTGSDVTKQAADMVLLDDDFATIVAAVREGRGIFDNIKKAMHFLLTGNLAEIGLMVTAALAGWSVPLTALQILWINLVTDGLPALALAVDPTEADAMRRRPLGRRAPIVSTREGASILVRAALLVGAAATAFALTLRTDAARAGTVAFSILVLGQLAYVFAFRSRVRTLPELGPFSNRKLVLAVAATAVLQLVIQSVPEARTLFELEALGRRDWALVLAACLAPVTAIEVAKLVRHAFRRTA